MFDTLFQNDTPLNAKYCVSTDGIQILYASSVEINGFHPVFLDYLKSDNLLNTTITVRLHPREKEKKEIFEKVLLDKNIKYVFDNSMNWLEANTVKNLIVISPWSSVIEEASDNEFKTIIKIKSIK